MKDYIIYMDTDSIFIRLQDFILDQLGPAHAKKWKKLSETKRIEYCIKISKVIEKYVNEKVFRQVQQIDFCSAEDAFRIVFKQEVVARNMIVNKKKKYALWAVSEEGARVDETTIKGMEIIRSDSPIMIKKQLRDLVQQILRGADDDALYELIAKYREELKSASPSEIAENKGVNNVNKFIKAGEVHDDDDAWAEGADDSDGAEIGKGATMQAKAVFNWRVMREKLKLEDQYEDIEEGNKTKIVYLMKNQYGIDAMAFPDVWPPEFEAAGLHINYKKMIENHFTKKLSMLLGPLGKSHLMTDTHQLLNLFF